MFGIIQQSLDTWTCLHFLYKIILTNCTSKKINAMHINSPITDLKKGFYSRPGLRHLRVCVFCLKNMSYTDSNSNWTFIALNLPIQEDSKAQQNKKQLTKFQYPVT